MRLGALSSGQLDDGKRSLVLGGGAISQLRTRFSISLLPLRDAHVVESRLKLA